MLGGLLLAIIPDYLSLYTRIAMAKWLSRNFAVVIYSTTDIGHMAVYEVQ